MLPNYCVLYYTSKLSQRNQNSKSKNIYRTNNIVYFGFILYVIRIYLTNSSDMHIAQHKNRNESRSGNIYYFQITDSSYSSKPCRPSVYNLVILFLLILFIHFFCVWFLCSLILKSFALYCFCSLQIHKHGKTTIFRVQDVRCILKPYHLHLLA